MGLALGWVVRWMGRFAHGGVLTFSRASTRFAEDGVSFACAAHGEGFLSLTLTLATGGVDGELVLLLFRGHLWRLVSGLLV